MHVYRWVCPHGLKKLPKALLQQFQLKTTPASPDAEVVERRRIELLDSRPWFAAFQPADAPLKL
jgi:hypothetical protein